MIKRTDRRRRDEPTEDRREDKHDWKVTKSAGKVEKIEAKSILQKYKAQKFKWLFLLLALGFGIVMFASSGAAGLLTKAKGLIGL